jgi:polysaccharide pyruvyl transferase WcaK-like protein
MGGEKRRINYVGWLGHGNLGDEAVYKAISELLSCFTLVPASMNYADYSDVSPITILGDSTGIPEWLEAIRPTAYNYVFGSGVKDPLFFGYDYVFREALKCSVAINRLKFFKAIGVRGDLSRDLLATRGIKSEVIGDVSFSLRPSRSIKRTDNKIAIAVGSDGILWGMNEERLLREVAKVCRNLKREGYELFLLPFWIKNFQRLKRFADEEGIILFDNWFDPQSSLDFIASCNMVIGERLHALGLSAAAGTPFITLEYQPKCYELAQSVGFEGYAIRTDSALEERIMNVFRHLCDNYEKMKELLDAKIDFYRKKQKQFALRIIQDTESLPECYWTMSPVNQFVNNFVWKTDLFLSRKPQLWYAWNRAFFSHAMSCFV